MAPPPLGSTIERPQRGTNNPQPLVPTGAMHHDLKYVFRNSFFFNSYFRRLRFNCSYYPCTHIHTQFRFLLVPMPIAHTGLPVHPTSFCKVESWAIASIRVTPRARVCVCVCWTTAQMKDRPHSLGATRHHPMKEPSALQGIHQKEPERLPTVFFFFLLFDPVARLLLSFSSPPFPASCIRGQMAIPKLQTSINLPKLRLHVLSTLPALDPKTPFTQHLDLLKTTSRLAHKLEQQSYRTFLLLSNRPTPSSTSVDEHGQSSVVLSNAEGLLEMSMALAFKFCKIALVLLPPLPTYQRRLYRALLRRLEAEAGAFLIQIHQFCQDGAHGYWHSRQERDGKCNVPGRLPHNDFCDHSIVADQDEHPVHDLLLLLQVGSSLRPPSHHDPRVTMTCAMLNRASGPASLETLQEQVSCATSTSHHRSITLIVPPKDQTRNHAVIPGGSQSTLFPPPLPTPPTLPDATVALQKSPPRASPLPPLLNPVVASKGLSSPTAALPSILVKTPTAAKSSLMTSALSSPSSVLSSPSSAQSGSSLSSTSRMIDTNIIMATSRSNPTMPFSSKKHTTGVQALIQLFNDTPSLSVDRDSANTSYKLMGRGTPRASSLPSSLVLARTSGKS